MTNCCSAAPTLDLQLVASGATNPVYVTHAGDGSGRLFIVEQNGRIKIFNGTNILATPFLNITNLMLFSGEQGLLSVAFHPGYATNGHVYVYFTNPSGSSNVVARFTAFPPGANTVNTNTLQTVLRIAHVNASNHNGGQLQFGPDGCLYIGTGDGGGSCDNTGPGNNAQNLGSLLGKLLRIDVGNPATNYTIPPGNPFVSTNGALPEIWAYGLRNPWRFSFDRATGDLWIGDVGQGPTNPREEVDFRPADSAGGENYGWRCFEGFLTNTCGLACSNYPTTLPILDYDHSSGRCAITGGYRYRGAKIPPLVGTYLYADECGGQVYGAATNGIGGWTSMLLTDSVFTVTTFGEDESGEVYLSQYANNGAIYRIVWKDTDNDGMPDDFESANGFNPNNPADAGQDADGDQASNLAEFRAGTDPHDSASVLRITDIAPDGADFVVGFTTVAGKLYDLDWTDDLVTGTWVAIVTNIPGSGGIVPVADPGASAQPQRFYRVRLVP